ncbi:MULTISPECIES: YcnI family copper-binding membrane protein [Amycolatopsis]|uniref:YncI copper-binding domain-containing protein n=1 Tax=Amycolatopsis dongchuanensis TaxID=1070866 RepID=A0ABP9PYY3_9PSEU
MPVLPRSRRLAVAVLAGTALALACQPVASAHVSASPDTVTPGEPATISFRVPNERDDATTVRLEVVFPADAHLGSATPENLPGWHITAVKQEGGTGHGMDDAPVSSIVWEGGPVPVGTFQDFPVRLGALPGGGTLSFEALQTYSDGEVVRWAERAQPGQPEPEHPAPTVTVAATTGPSTSDILSRALGGCALGVALLALGVAWLRRRPAGRPEAVAEREEVRL